MSAGSAYVSACSCAYVCVCACECGCGCILRVHGFHAESVILLSAQQLSVAFPITFGIYMDQPYACT